MQVDDEYAKRFMEGEGAALYFDKRLAPPRMRWLLLAGFAVGAGALGVAALKDPSALWGLLPIGAGAVFSTTFWSLRTVVTRRFVHIQYGLFGPRIPVGDVISVDVVDYAWIRFGGFGIRYDVIRGEVAYNMMGDQGRAVKIVYRDGARTRTLLVSAAHPERLRDAIRAAQTAGVDALGEARASFGLNDAADVGAVSDVDAAVGSDASAEASVGVDEAVKRR